LKFWVGLQTSNIRKGGQRGSGMVPSERALVSSYRPSIVTFPLSLRVSEIGLLSLLYSSTPLFPTPPLVSLKFPRVPLGVDGWPLGYEERRCWANRQPVQLVSKISNLCDPDPPTSQTDRRTEDMHHAVKSSRYTV